MMRLLKRDYIQESLKQNHGNPKKLWCTIREIWPSNKSTQEITKINNQTDPKQIAEELNNHFVTIGPKLSQHFQGNSTQIPENNGTDAVFSLAEKSMRKSTN